MPKNLLAKKTQKTTFVCASLTNGLSLGVGLTLSANHWVSFTINSMN